MIYEEPSYSIEVVESDIKIDFIFEEGVNDEEELNFNINILPFLHDSDDIEKEHLIISKKHKYIWMNYEYKGTNKNMPVIDGIDSDGRLIDELKIDDGPIWELENYSESYNKEDNLALKAVRNSINDILFSFANYADFNLDKNKDDYVYIWDNDSNGPKPDLEDGLHDVVVLDAEGNEKEYKNIKFPEYINDLEKLAQLYKAKKSIKKRIDKDIHITILRKHLPNGEYYIMLSDERKIIHEQSYTINNEE